MCSKIWNSQTVGFNFTAKSTGNVTTVKMKLCNLFQLYFKLNMEQQLKTNYFVSTIIVHINLNYILSHSLFPFLLFWYWSQFETILPALYFKSIRKMKLVHSLNSSWSTNWHMLFPGISIYQATSASSLQELLCDWLLRWYICLEMNNKNISDSFHS
jgi:hypothetical protein